MATEHDPLCIAPHPMLSNSNQCVYCELISKVREDQKIKDHDEYHRGYDEGRADERAFHEQKAAAHVKSRFPYIGK